MTRTDDSYPSSWEVEGGKIVFIETSGGVEAMLAPGKLATELRDSGREAVGIVLDADNRAPGMLETLARSLAPTGSSEALLELAERSCDDAAKQAAPFRPVHRDKAIIHTWLAWQDPPGQQLHGAIKQNMLDPKLPQGQAFIRWFRKLFQI